MAFRPTPVNEETLAEIPTNDWRIVLPGIYRIGDLEEIGYPEILWWRFKPWGTDRRVYPWKEGRYFKAKQMGRYELYGKNDISPIVLSEAFNEAVNSFDMPNIRLSKYNLVKLEDAGYIFVIKRNTKDSFVSMINNRPASQFTPQELQSILNQTRILVNHARPCRLRTKIVARNVCFWDGNSIPLPGI